MSDTPRIDAMMHSGHAHYMSLDLAAKLERENNLLRNALQKLLTAAENIGGEHVTGWQYLTDACVTAEQVLLKIKEPA